MKVTFTESALGEQHTSELMVLLKLAKSNG